MQVAISHHANERISERFGIKSRANAVKYVQTVYEQGEEERVRGGYVKKLYRGHSFLFTMSRSKTGEIVPLLVTVMHGKDVHKSINKSVTSKRVKYKCHYDTWGEAA